jgi:hypothetical protein
MGGYVAILDGDGCIVRDLFFACLSAPKAQRATPMPN